DSQGPKSLEDEVADDAGKKSTEVPRKRIEFRIQQKMVTKMINRRIVAGSTYVYLSGSIPVNAATLPNANLSIDPLMPDLKDTVDTRIFSGAYDDKVESAEANFYRD
nr:hypothetical protein [Tanacetum cinerariifolium]